MITKIKKSDVIVQINKEIDFELEALHRCVLAGDEEGKERHKEKLSILHETLCTLGYWSDLIKANVKPKELVQVTQK
jgi:hypothetical protein